MKSNPPVRMSKLIVFSLLLVAVQLASSASLKNFTKVWTFDSDKEIVDPNGESTMSQVVCYGWYCKTVERVMAICKGKDFSLTPKIDYTCSLLDPSKDYRLVYYSITCKDFSEPTNDHCYLTVYVYLIE